MLTVFCLVVERERGHLEDPRLAEWIILKWIFRKRNGVKYWIEDLQSRGRQRKI